MPQSPTEEDILSARKYRKKAFKGESMFPPPIIPVAVAKWLPISTVDLSAIARTSAAVTSPVAPKPPVSILQPFLSGSPSVSSSCP
jgi:hypothetical protein